MDNSFGNTLALIRDGDCVDEASQKLQELVAAVRETGKPGSLTITLKAKPATIRGAIGTLVIDDDVTVKLPKAGKAQSLFFATEANTLQRSDPNQQELQLKTVEGGQVAPENLKRVNAS